MVNDLYRNSDVYFKSLLLKESIAVYVMQNRKTARYTSEKERLGREKLFPKDVLEYDMVMDCIIELNGKNRPDRFRFTKGINFSHS